MITLLKRFGVSEGRRTGPLPGDGASSIGGFHDADGTPNDVLPPPPGEPWKPDGRTATTRIKVKPWIEPDLERRKEGELAPSL